MVEQYWFVDLHGAWRITGGVLITQRTIHMNHRSDYVCPFRGRDTCRADDAEGSLVYLQLYN